MPLTWTRSAGRCTDGCTNFNKSAGKCTDGFNVGTGAPPWALRHCYAFFRRVRLNGTDTAIDVATVAKGLEISKKCYATSIISAPARHAAASIHFGMHSPFECSSIFFCVSQRSALAVAVAKHCTEMPQQRLPAGMQYVMLSGLYHAEAPSLHVQCF